MEGPQDRARTVKGGGPTMKSFNWPQASSPSQGAYLVQAAWYDYDLDISEVNLRYSSGDTEFTKLKNLIKTEFNDVAGPNGESVDEWGLSLMVLDLIPDELDNTTTNFHLSFSNEEPTYHPTMFQKIEDFLEKFWNREWVVGFWTSGDTFEWKIRKVGPGPLAQRP